MASVKAFQVLSPSPALPYTLRQDFPQEEDPNQSEGQGGTGGGGFHNPE